MTSRQEDIFRFKSLSEFHRFRQLSQPLHPLLSVIDLSTVEDTMHGQSQSLVFEFYTISLKREFTAKVRYGQQQFDFDSGLMSFQAPGQVIRIEPAAGHVLKPSGWLLLIHPDFLWNTPLAKKIRQYDFFDYAVNEALFLSEKEEAILTGIIANIDLEYHLPIDKFSQQIVLAQLEALLAYCDRFYQRQFVTRKITNHQVLHTLETLLTDYFNSEEIVKNGLPAVAWLAQQLHVSPHYLSAMLRSVTGLNTQQHIHARVIERAKELLSTTSMSVSDIAYSLGFGHLQSFSKLFKTKTTMSPLAFRQSFN